MACLDVKTWHAAWQHQDIEIKQDNFIGGNHFQLKQLQLRHKRFSGQWSPWLLREQICRQDAAAVLLCDPELKQFVLVEQFRVGLIGRSAEDSPWLLEIVAGLLESGEDPIATVQREALEETGCEVKQLHKIFDFFNTPGGFSEKTSLFYGTVEAKNIGGIHGLVEEQEDIKVHVLSIAEILSAFDSGSLVTSASTALALQWFALHYYQGTLPF